MDGRAVLPMCKKKWAGFGVPEKVAWMMERKEGRKQRPADWRPAIRLCNPIRGREPWRLFPFPFSSSSFPFLWRPSRSHRCTDTYNAVDFYGRGTCHRRLEPGGGRCSAWVGARTPPEETKCCHSPCTGQGARPRQGMYLLPRALCLVQLADRHQ